MPGHAGRLSGIGCAGGTLRFRFRRPSLCDPGGQRNKGDNTSAARRFLILVFAFACLLAAKTSALGQELRITLSKDVLYEITSDVEDKNINQIKNQVAAANSYLESFNLTRSPDSIKLSFSLWSGGRKIDFDLIGEKADYYRMAMGVSLDETFATLISNDKRLKSGGAQGDKVNVTLVLNVGGDEEKKKAPEEKPAPSRDQEITRAYAAALESANPEKLQEFATRYPDSPKALMAKKYAERLNSDAEYAHLGPNASSEVLKSFLARYPSTKYLAEITKRLVEIEKTANARAAEEERLRAQAEAEKREREEAEQARKERLAEERRNQEAARKERDQFNRGKGSIEGLKAYLAEYPEGAYSAEATAQLTKFRKEKEEEEKALGGKMLLIAPYSAKAPVVDGDPSDSAWSAATPINVELDPQTRRAQKNSVEVRALVNRGRIYMRLRWRDATPDTSYRPWKWDQTKGRYSQTEELDDAVAISIYASGSVDDSCMLLGKSQKADIWLWRAFWSSVSGKASDQMMTISPERLPKANPYPSRTGREQLWVQNMPDKGKQGWRYDIPVAAAAPKPTLPSYKTDTASGSAADVDAAGKYKDGVWTAEFSRLLDTGNDDDIALPLNGRVLISFATFDKAERENHSSSQLVILETQGR